MISVPVLCTPHTHWREVFERTEGDGDIVIPLVKLSLQGGARLFGPMPNTVHGLMNATAVLAYLAHAQKSVPEGMKVHMVGIVQITEATTKADIDDCVAAGIMDAKIYPKGRTTKSHNGVQHYMRILDIVRYAGERGMRVHFHPEHPSELFDNRDAEFAFLPIMDIFMNETRAVIIWEHGTDARCIPFWEEWGKTGRFFVTITAHHPLVNETSAYGDVGTACKPPAKTEIDRRGLVALIAKNYSWVMAGADDAPHPLWDKHRIGNCACGAYTAPFLLPLFAHALLRYMSFKAFVNFISFNAQRLYDVILLERLELVETPFQIPKLYKIGFWEVEPFWAGRTIDFSLEEVSAA